MTFDLSKDFGCLQKASRIRQLGFGIATVPADRIDLPAYLEAADIGTRLICRYLVLQREPNTGAIRDLEPQWVVCRHQTPQSAS